MKKLFYKIIQLFFLVVFVFSAAPMCLAAVNHQDTIPQEVSVSQTSDSHCCSEKNINIVQTSVYLVKDNVLNHFFQIKFSSTLSFSVINPALTSLRPNGTAEGRTKLSFVQQELSMVFRS